MPVRSPSWPRRTLYGLVISTSVLALTEIGLRLGGVGPAYLSSRLGRWQTHQGLKNRRMYGTREPHDFILSTNADGLRTAHSPSRTAGLPRVALMGDSNVFGWGIGNHQTLAAQTEARLQERGHAVEIINAGQPGYSTAQVSWLFQETLAAYTPDLTIVFLSMHDHNRALVSDSETWRGAQGPRATVRVLLAKHLRIYEFLRRQIYPQYDTPQLMPDDPSESARVRRVSGSERAERLREMRDLASEWGGVIALGLMPDVSDLSQNMGADLYPRHGQSWAEAWSVLTGNDMFNLRDCCPGEGEAYVFSFDHGHMNAGGNEAASHALTRALEIRLGL